MKVFKYSLSLLLLLVIFSCALENRSGAGDITFTVPPISFSLGSGDSTYARIYLVANDTFYPIQKNVIYQDVELSSSATSVTIDNIPAGPEYRVFFSLGAAGRENDPGFDASSYGESTGFKVIPGSDVTVSITLAASPFAKSSDLLGKDLNGVAVLSGNIYASDSQKVYDCDTFPDFSGTLSSQSIASGYSINSISPWSVPSTLLVNTNKGIVRYDQMQSDPGNFSSNLADGPVSVLESGVSSNNYVYYQRDKGLGAVDISSGVPATYDWHDIDLSDYVAGQPVLDFFTTTTHGYFASRIGAFRLSETDITLLTEETFMSKIHFFEIRKNSVNLPITSLDYRSNDSTVFIGTKDGLWQATENSDDGVIIDSLSLLPATAGHSFKKLTVSTSYTVGLSDLYLFVFNSNDTLVKKLPFNSGLPGTVKSMVWFNDDTLLIAGDRGLVSLDCGGL